MRFCTSSFFLSVLLGQQQDPDHTMFTATSITQPFVQTGCPVKLLIHCSSCVRLMPICCHQDIHTWPGHCKEPDYAASSLHQPTSASLTELQSRHIVGLLVKTPFFSRKKISRQQCPWESCCSPSAPMSHRSPTWWARQCHIAWLLPHCQPDRHTVSRLMPPPPSRCSFLGGCSSSKPHKLAPGQHHGLSEITASAGQK